MKRKAPDSYSDVDEALINVALRDIKQNKLSVENAARKYYVSLSTLRGRYEEYLASIPTSSDDVQGKEETSESSSKPVSRPRQYTFTPKEEEVLLKIIQKMFDMQKNVTAEKVRELIYEYAIKMNKKVGAAWIDMKMARSRWWYRFLKQHPNIKINCDKSNPLNTSTEDLKFNIEKINNFFTSWSSIVGEFTPDRIVNVDEFEETLKSTDPYRPEVVTTVGIVTASGAAVPPVFNISGVNDKRDLRGLHPGSLLLYHENFRDGAFVKVLEHIKKFLHCSNENPVLILLDREPVHCESNVIMYAVENGMELVPMPLDIRYKMQPLDTLVFHRFKQCLQEEKRKLTSNFLVYDIPGLCSVPFLKSFNMENILQAFESTGLYPVDQAKFMANIFGLDSEGEELASSDSDTDQTESDTKPHNESPIFVASVAPDVHDSR
jgi:hypothetical protein